MTCFDRMTTQPDSSGIKPRMTNGRQLAPLHGSSKAQTSLDRRHSCYARNPARLKSDIDLSGVFVRSSDPFDGGRSQAPRSCGTDRRDGALLLTSTF